MAREVDALVLGARAEVVAAGRMRGCRLTSSESVPGS
jgi:hypothetical protein